MPTLTARGSASCPAPHNPSLKAARRRPGFRSPEFSRVGAVLLGPSCRRRPRVQPRPERSKGQKTPACTAARRSSTGAKGGAGGQNADTTRVPNLSLLCRRRFIHRSEPPPIPARVVRRLRLNAIPLPESWLREFRRVAASAERPFSRASFHGAHICCGRAGGASQALVGHNPLPPPPVLGYSRLPISRALADTCGNSLSAKSW